MSKLQISQTMKALLSNQMNSKVASMMSIRKLSEDSQQKYETLKVTSPHDYVYHIQINRPQTRNAMNPTFFDEIKQCFEELNFDPACRSIVLSGMGKGFTSGLDLSDLSQLVNNSEQDVARKGFHTKKIIDAWQASMSSPEECHKPVIASVHGFCVGGGIDLITACDIRYCSQDAFFTVKEVDIGLAADIGTLQRFPKIVGNESLARELVYTARRFSAEEAKQLGLVSKIMPDEESCVNESLELAKLIASKSPVAVQGSKINMLHARDHGVQAGLKYTASWNAGMIQSEDIMTAAMASMAKETPVFSKL